MILETHDSPAPDLVAFLSDSLYVHNCRVTGTDDYRTFALVLRDDTGHVTGGASGWTRWGWLHLDVLWIDDAHRGQGHGSWLLLQVEDLAMARGCELVTLDTASFQAPDFYRHHGYQEMFRMEVPRHGIVKYHFRKDLPPFRAGHRPHSDGLQGS
jgi:GNAT superfamily N-acetyltransferase